RRWRPHHRRRRRPRHPVRAPRGAVRALRRRAARRQRPRPRGRAPRRRAARRPARPRPDRARRLGLALPAPRRKHMARILIVDAEAKLGRVLVEVLDGRGHEVERVGNGQEALARVARGGVDILVTDLRMPGVDGMEVLRQTRRASPATDVVLMTAYASAQGAVAAMKEGAVDYLIKPFAIDEFRLRIERLAERRALSEHADALARRLDRAEGFAGVVARSPKMTALVEAARRVAVTDETVLLLGESGTGKTRLARAIHNASRRADGPFVEVHCAALPE